MGALPWIVSDDLWERIEPLLPSKERRFRYPGRKPLPARVEIEGPRAAAIAARKFYGAATRAVVTGLDLDEEPQSRQEMAECLRELYSARDEYVNVARDVLDKDGTAPPFPDLGPIHGLRSPRREH